MQNSIEEKSIPEKNDQISNNLIPIVPSFSPENEQQAIKSVLDQESKDIILDELKSCYDRYYLRAAEKEIEEIDATMTEVLSSTMFDDLLLIIQNHHTIIKIFTNKNIQRLRWSEFLKLFE
jgi:Fe-S cluster assembly ATPase SufC